MKDIKQLIMLVMLALRALWSRFQEWLRKLLAYLLALFGLVLVACSSYPYRTMQIHGATAVEIQCANFAECLYTAHLSCQDGRYVILGQTATSLVFQCTEMSNDTSRSYERQH